MMPSPWTLLAWPLLFVPMPARWMPIKAIGLVVLLLTW